MRLQIPMITRMSCSMTRTPQSSRAGRLEMVSASSSLSTSLSPAAGSSRNRKRGRIAIARAT